MTITGVTLCSTSWKRVYRDSIVVEPYSKGKGWNKETNEYRGLREERENEKERKQLASEPSVYDCLRFSRVIGREWFAVRRSIARTIVEKTRADPFCMEEAQVPSHALTNRDVKQMFRLFGLLWELLPDVLLVNFSDRLPTLEISMIVPRWRFARCLRKPLNSLFRYLIDIWKGLLHFVQIIRCALLVFICAWNLDTECCSFSRSNFIKFSYRQV